MAPSPRQSLLVILGAVLGVTLTVGHAVLADRHSGSTIAEQLPLEQLRTFTNVFTLIKKNYVEPVSDEQLLQYAIQGMLNGLDPHSAYLDPMEYKNLRIGTRGEFGGLGIQVTMENGFVKVIAPIDDTPAKRAGIQAGDLIVRINGQPVKGMTLNDAVKIMRGEPGSEIDLTIVREGRDKPLQITITRAIIEVESVKARMLAPGYGYLRISHFQTNTQEAVDEALRRLTEKAGGQLKGLVLDLRNNPGGVLSAAVSVADTFLTEGLIVYTEGRTPGSRLRYTAHPGDAIDGAPLVVLVNQGSASASEIVAGALQDHERALIVGHRTFGKGSVQTIQNLPNGGALKLTTARYYTPDGSSIQAEGIKPDIRTGAYQVKPAPDNGLAPLTEADLAQHLLNKQDDKERKSDAAKSANPAQLATKDYELYIALSLLKGLHILGPQG